MIGASSSSSANQQKDSDDGDHDHHHIGTPPKVNQWTNWSERSNNLAFVETTERDSGVPFKFWNDRALSRRPLQTQGIFSDCPPQGRQLRC
jgi:hypothetical protein